MADEIETLANDVYRDMEAPGSAVKHDPIKASIRALFALISGMVDAFSNIVLSGRIEKATWALLQPIVPAGGAGIAAAVPLTDAGTHTDPVVGGTVPNSGVYSYSTSPAGWQRIGNYQALTPASQAEVDTGTDTAKAVTAATLRNAKTTKETVIPIEYVSGPGNAMIWRPINPRHLLTGDATQYRFRGVMPFDSIASTAIALTQPDGTAFLTSTSVRMPNGIDQTPEGGLKQGDSFEILRNHVPLATYELGLQGLFRLLPPPAYGVGTILPTAHALDEFGLPLSIDRPVDLRQTGDNTYIIGTKMMDSSSYYGTGVPFWHSDKFVSTMFDMRDFQANVPNGALCFNSFFARVGTANVPVTNLQFTALVVGNTTDVGQVPSTFEPPIFAGKNSDATTGPGTETNFAPRGIGHGYMTGTAVTLIGTLEGVASANLYGGDEKLTWNGDKLVSTVTGSITATDGTILAALTYTTTYEPTANQQVRIQAFYNFGSAAVTPATTGSGAYAFPIPIQNCDRIVGFLNGVRVTGVGASVNGVHIINLRDTTVTNLGVIDKAIAWNSEHPDIQVVMTNNIGLGKSVKINGVAQTATVASGVQNNVWGAKLLGTPVFALGSAKRLLTGETWEFDYGIKVIRDAPIT